MTEREERLDLLLVRPTVTDIDILLIFHCKILRIIGIEGMGTIVFKLHRECERQLS